MRFLIDAQLPPALAKHLSRLGHEARHLVEFDELSAPDHAVWARARGLGAVLVTKDEDFVTMRALERGDGPSLLWVRFGNTTSRILIDRLVKALPTIIAAFNRGETIVELS